MQLSKDILDAMYTACGIAYAKLSNESSSISTGILEGKYDEEKGTRAIIRIWKLSNNIDEAKAILAELLKEADEADEADND